MFIYFLFKQRKHEQLVCWQLLNYIQMELILLKNVVF